MDRLKEMSWKQGQVHVSQAGMCSTCASRHMLQGVRLRRTPAPHVASDRLCMPSMDTARLGYPGHGCGAESGEAVGVHLAMVAYTAFHSAEMSRCRLMRSA